MGKIADRFLLFIYSLAILAASIVLISITLHWIPPNITADTLSAIYSYTAVRYGSLAGACITLLISLRLLYLSLRSGGADVPSIDQRTEFGDVRISLETIENLALKSAARSRGVKDLKARVRVSDAGIEIMLRSLVDGEVSIPELTEEVQRAVKEHVESITGIPVSDVSVYIANVIQSNTFKSRVE